MTLVLSFAKSIVGFEKYVGVIVIYIHMHNRAGINWYTAMDTTHQTVGGRGEGLRPGQLRDVSTIGFLKLLTEIQTNKSHAILCNTMIIISRFDIVHAW